MYSQRVKAVVTQALIRMQQPQWWLADQLRITPSQLSRTLNGELTMPFERAALWGRILDLNEIQTKELRLLMELHETPPTVQGYVIELEKKAARCERRLQHLEKLFRESGAKFRSDEETKNEGEL